MKQTDPNIVALASWTLWAASANADTIFDVEHARAAARAGLVSEDDVQYLRRWGATSGYYPPPRLRRPLFERRIPDFYDRRYRRW
jgi:hypothetical protein